MALAKDKSAQNSWANWENFTALLGFAATALLIYWIIWKGAEPCEPMRNHLHKSLAGSLLLLKGTILGYEDAGANPDFDWNAINREGFDEIQMEKLKASLENHASNVERHIKDFQNDLALAQKLYSDSPDSQRILLESHSIGDEMIRDIVGMLESDDIDPSKVAEFRVAVVAELDHAYLVLLNAEGEEVPSIAKDSSSGDS